MKIEVWTEGFDRLGRGLSELAEGTGNLARAEGELRRELPEVEREYFDSQGRGHWQPLARKSAERKIERHGFKPIMRAQDALRDSLVRLGAPGSVWEVTDGEIVYGSALRHARPQHFGVRKHNLPARPLFPPAEEFGRVVFRVVRADSAEFAEGLGFDVKG